VSTSTFNRNALLNMANDAVRTRFYLTNINPDLGQVLSASAAEHCTRAAQHAVSAGETGSLWVLPQLTLTDLPLSAATPEKLVQLKNRRSDKVALFDRSVDACQAPCSPPAPVSPEESTAASLLYDLWFSVTLKDLDVVMPKIKPASVHMEQPPSPGVAAMSVAEVQASLNAYKQALLTFAFDSAKKPAWEHHTQQVLLVDSFSSQSNALTFQTGRLQVRPARAKQAQSVAQLLFCGRSGQNRGRKRIERNEGVFFCLGSGQARRLLGRDPPNPRCAW
jgi:hypothetical protein